MVRTSLPLPLPLSVGGVPPWSVDQGGWRPHFAAALWSSLRCGHKGKGAAGIHRCWGHRWFRFREWVPSVGTDGKHPMGEGAVRLGLIRSPAMTARETAFGFPLVSFGVWLYLRTPFSGSPAPASHGLSVVLTEETRRVCARV